MTSSVNFTVIIQKSSHGWPTFPVILLDDITGINFYCLHGFVDGKYCFWIKEKGLEGIAVTGYCM